MFSRYLVSIFFNVLLASSLLSGEAELDKSLLNNDREFDRAVGFGPGAAVHSGQPPKTAQLVSQKKEFPKHWGDPPKLQTRDLRELPGGYGRGSSTLARWIQENLDKDAANQAQVASTDSSPTKDSSDEPLIEPRQPSGNGDVSVSGELKQWHNVTISLAGPYAHEKDNRPNPFADYRMEVSFKHADGTTYLIPGYFAADGDAKNTSAESGTIWRAHFAPDRTGRWNYSISFHAGERSAFDKKLGEPLPPFHGQKGTFYISASDKSAPDLRARGRLQYVGKRYLQFVGSGQYFLKVGADAPETLLAYADFDNTIAGNPKKAPIKTWSPHIDDWHSGDPTWKDGKGKGLIGAINYLSGKGCNAFSFLTYNAGGDGDNVWPFVHRDDKLHYDCSKLDQWETVFEHGTAKGMYLHFKLQETENDDHTKQGTKYVPECLDGGNLGLQRKMY
ncbi:MAG: DUF5060 domain-containing protein, partial [Planctomycetales bacterium]|nr:DUF5060 domain-containing protein [Planctomycetales bacterium]